MIDTKKAPGRRTLHFDTMDDIARDVDAMDASARTTVGNWNAAQILEHVTMVIEGALDGVPVKAPLLWRVLGPMMKSRALAKTFGPGFRLKGRFASLLPSDDVTWEAARERFRTAVERTRTERMEARSPVLGTMTHDDWVRLHCRHAELHFSFVQV